MTKFDFSTLKKQEPKEEIPMDSGIQNARKILNGEDPREVLSMEMDTPITTTEKNIITIIKETGITRKEIQDLVKEKQEELKGLISEEGALFMIAKDLSVYIEDNHYSNDKQAQEKFNKSIEMSMDSMEEQEVKQEVVSMEMEETTMEIIEEETMETGIVLTGGEDKKPQFSLALPSDEMNLPSKEEIDLKYEILEYIKRKVVSKKEDYENVNGKPYLKASGTAKFINYFKLNISYPHREIINDDYGQHCEFICRVEAPWGQVVESYGNASMKTMKLGKTRHNMVSLAETRARTRAIRIIMGFTEPSYAEMHGQEPIRNSKKDVECEM